MAKLKVRYDHPHLRLSGGCNTRACGGTWKREIEAGDLFDLLAPDARRDQIMLAVQAFRAAAAKIGLSTDREPTEVDVPLICEECQRILNDHRREDGDDPDA